MKCPYCDAELDLDRGSQIECDNCGAWIDNAGNWHRGDKKVLCRVLYREGGKL